MAFNTAITGLKASTIDLDVTGNNIANASTVGYKAARTEFSDIFTTVVVGAGSTNNPGAGVIVSDIAQDFTAGTIEFTNNNLDLAIDGTGFFQLNDGQGGITYTRAGGFELDKDGNVISKTGKFLQGYGLDEAGNQQPIGNLAVSQKESAPQATENIDLSFNIDSRADATGLRQPYDPDDSASFTFSTTSRTFDSLGNENTIKFDLVEQGPERERQTINFDDATVAGDVIFAGATISVTAANPLVAADPATAAEIAAVIADSFNNPGTPDPFRLDFRDNIASLTAVGDEVIVTFKASATDVDEIVVNDSGLAPATPAVVTSENISAGEVQSVAIADAGVLAANTTISFGGVDIGVASGDTASTIISSILAKQNDILSANPTIDSIEAGSGAIIINYKPEEGNVDLLAIDQGVTPVFGGLTESVEVEVGDNSYEGVYQMFAYLNGDELLDIGRSVSPGEPGGAAVPPDTEPGPILLVFDSTNGVLQTVNGDPVNSSGLAPKLTIEGADPADPDTEILLDLTGTTQFASESIVKASTQDGFAKGDLIGVTFASDGTMVASFSNGQNTNLGIVALATFENQSGLQSVGDTEWSATLDSGQAILNPPGTGLNGQLRSAALEQSNVDLSEELVALIEAQRNFQANSKTLQTENAITQTILQIQ